MAVDVRVFPKDSIGAEWIEKNFDSLNTAFTETHRSGDPALSGDHPHGLLLDHHLTPDLPRVSVYAAAHWNIAHAERTIEDLRRCLAKLDADLAGFEIEHTGD